uniref:prolyl oligopeptidase family serine peptidase n=1 Tax=Aetokthonos hydrillicola TaxID=1550245 RepID=UPI001ABB8CFA
IVALLSSNIPQVQALEKRLLTLDDQFSVHKVSDPQISPDGKWIAHTVENVNVKNNTRDNDIYMSSWDGSQTLRLTTSKDSEYFPRFSPDGKYLAFLSSRQYEGGSNQIWLLNLAGGEAERISDFKGGVSDFVWSPDGKQLAVVAEDPDDKQESKTPPPIVIDRFQFKEDGSGYLGKKRDHIYLLNLANRKADILTQDNFNEYFPSWSPDSKKIAFATKRGADFDRHNNWDVYVIEAKLGAKARQLTTFDGPDSDPSWNSRPVWSPDGKLIAYLQGGAQKLIEYAVHQLAVIPASGGSPRLLSPTIDRNIAKPRFTANGRSIVFLLEDDQVVHLAKVSVTGGKVQRLLSGRRNVSAFDLSRNEKIALLSSTPQEPNEVFALTNNHLRLLSHQNQDLLAKLKLGNTKEISFNSKDGTQIHGFIVTPPDFKPGKLYPTIVRIHGGPVGQYTNQFMFDLQIFAAHGYVVLAPNPRGSSGRGEAFSKAIYADWGNKDAQDILAAVDYAIAQGIADPSRLGIGGWSYGGILTNYTIAQDQRFKAAISGASTSNILAGYGTDAYVRDYEQELGVPWKNLNTWLRLSFPFLHADRIGTPTLFLCGEQDAEVPLLNSEQMYQALRSIGVDTQLIIYPGQSHGISNPSYMRDQLERYLAWYDKYLMQ